MNEHVRKAHKVACAIGRKLNVDVAVHRLPMPNGRIAFDFCLADRHAAFGQSFLEDNLTQFAHRVMDALKESPHGHKKGHARH